MLLKSRRPRGLRCCTALLAAASLLASSGFAQAPAPPPESLQITIIDGEDAVNNIRQRTAREPIVQVEDQNHKPIAGATVLFQLPNDGAGGAFQGGAHTLTITTDSKGQAVAHGLKPNHVAGKYQIRVQASYQGKTAQTQIAQSNLAAAAASATTGIIIGVVVAVAVGVTAGMVASHTGSSATNLGTPVPIAIIPGVGVAGAPH